VGRSNANLTYRPRSVIGMGMTHMPPIKPGWEGMPRIALQLHIISYRAINPYVRVYIGEGETWLFNKAIGKRYI
jgi:hypothetical protein